jgi:flagellar assembly protein FliH
MTVFKQWRKKADKDDDKPSSHSLSEGQSKTKKIVYTQKKLIPHETRPQSGEPITVGKVKRPDTLPKTRPKTETSNVSLEDRVEHVRRQEQQHMQQELEQYRKSVLTELEQEKANLRNSAYQEGYDKGFAAGQAQFEALTTELKNAINGFAQEKQNILKQSEAGVIELALEVSKKVIQTKISESPDVLNNILKEALERVTDKDKVIIRVNSADLENVKQFQESFKKEFKDFKHIEIKSDPDIESGGCVIETDLGFVDSSISTKLSLIEAALNTARTENR